MIDASGRQGHVGANERLLLGLAAPLPARSVEAENDEEDIVYTDYKSKRAVLPGKLLASIILNPFSLLTFLIPEEEDDDSVVYTDY